jgi:hypothetical protein
MTGEPSNHPPDFTCFGPPHRSSERAQACVDRANVKPTDACKVLIAVSTNTIMIFCAGGTVAVFVLLVRQLSIGIGRDDDLKAVVVSVGAKSRQRWGPNPAKK